MSHSSESHSIPAPMSDPTALAKELVDDVDRDMISRGDRIGADQARSLLAHYDQSQALLEDNERLRRERGAYTQATIDLGGMVAHNVNRALTAEARIAVLEAALSNIRELNMAGADANGHRWANSDLIEQEIAAAIRARTP